MNLFDTYIYHIITDWKVEETKEIKISRNKDIKILLFADDQVIMANSEDTLHISIHKLERVKSQYGLKISKSKNKTMVLKELIQ